ncbi:MAG TPA: sigma-70 family RNA polymerase sigma factor [Bacteroidales bacterium]|nr:sigma-70 family RNA polymerase sigma factor [Bacteroidales bacterium]
MKVEEFKTLIFPLNRKLFAFAGRLLGDFSDAEDIMQDIYIKLWQKRDELHTYHNLEAFVMTMVRNQCLDKIKSRKTISIDEKFYQSERYASDPHQQLEIKDSFESIKKAIEALPEQQRTVIEMKDIQGHTTEEIVKILNLTPTAWPIILNFLRTKNCVFIIRLH